MHDEFVANLRLLCSYYPSIADVCRRLPINRTVQPLLERALKP